MFHHTNNILMELFIKFLISNSKRKEFFWEIKKKTQLSAM